MKGYFNIQPYDILLQFSMLRIILQPQQKKLLSENVSKGHKHPLIY
jgi:hypothetical protein